MKKLLVSIALLLFFQLSNYSQSLSLSDSQGQIPNNSTVFPHGSSEDDEIIAYAYVTNNSAAAMPVLVKKVEVDVTPGTINTFCWGLCYPPNIYVSSESITIGPGETNYIDFSGHLAPSGINGYSIIRYVFYDESDPSDTVCMNVHFAHFPVGIMNPGTATVFKAYPSPADEKISLDYRFPLQGQKAGIRICTSSGSVVREEPLINGSGKTILSTTTLANGLYFCVLYVNGTPAAIRKFIVAH